MQLKLFFLLKQSRKITQVESFSVAAMPGFVTNGTRTSFLSVKSGGLSSMMLVRLILMLLVQACRH